MDLGILLERYDFRLGAALLTAILITTLVGVNVNAEASNILVSDSEEEIELISESAAEQVQNRLNLMESELEALENGNSIDPSFIGLRNNEVEGDTTLSSGQASNLVSNSENLQGIFYKGELNDQNYVIAKNSDETAVIKESSELLNQVTTGDEMEAHVFVNSQLIASTDRDVAQNIEANEDTGIVVSEGNVYSSKKISGISGKVTVSTPESVFTSGKDQISSGILSMILVSAISLALVGVTVGSNTVIHLKKLSEKAEKMGSGNLEVDFSTDRKDEVGQLYESLDDTRVSLKENIEKAEKREVEAKEKREKLEETAQKYQEVMEKCAEGNLTKRISVNKDSKAMKQIGETFNSMMDEIEGTVSDMKTFTNEVSDSLIDFKDTAEEVVEKSKQMDASVAKIEEGAQQQYSYLDEVSEEMESLSTNAQEMAASADEAAESSEEAKEKGQKGRQMAENAVGEVKDIQSTTEETVEEIEELSEKMDRIDEIVDVITKVAEKTDMIAVNASVEASRAGESGESFAVVAEEIKKLAEETKDSASQIEDQIKEIRDQTDNTVSKVNSTNEGVESGVETIEESIGELEEVIEQVESMDTTIQEVGEITNEQAKSSKSVVEKIDKVSDISQRTNSKTEEVNKAAEEQMSSMKQVSEETEEMAERAKKLKEIVGKFEVGDE